MLLTEFFNQPEGDSRANHQTTSKATQNQRPQATTTNEHIVKVKGGYRLVSKKTGKNLGTYPTRAGAEKREREVQYFKHMDEDSWSGPNNAWNNGDDQWHSGDEVAEDFNVTNMVATEDASLSDIVQARELIGSAIRDPQNQKHKYFEFLKHLRNNTVQNTAPKFIKELHS